VTIHHYESTRTGMRVVVVDQKGPKLNGYFGLATEIHDDSGAPHTLEHLCFMGSKSWRYKGLLDKVASRLYSSTNAWTDTDSTVYTLESAGWEAFARILPVYLEHVILPTLTDSACYTEVHHVDGTGHDAGVVYSEMQGVQNASEELIDLRMRRLMYPEGNGFRYETGGMMEQLRVLPVDRIRQFHKLMYQPKNLRLVLTGEVDRDELLQILDAFEESIMDDIPPPDAPFQRPWTESGPTPPISEIVVSTVPFPEEDESMGEIMVGFRGPRFNDHLAGAALGILLLYICGSSISVLDNTLVEKEALCSSIWQQVQDRPDAAIYFSMNSVETDKLRFVYERFLEILKDTASKALDMSYLRDCVTRFRRQVKQSCEVAGDFFSVPILEDHMYGHRDGRDLKTLENLEDLDTVEGWSDRQWRDFLKEWLADAKHVVVLGVPSKELSEEITEKEKARVKAQQEKLGERGLQELAEKLAKAKEENDQPIPDTVLERFSVPSTDSIHFIPTVTARSGAARQMGKLGNHVQSLIDKDDDGSPLFLHFEHIPSNFVRVKLELCTGSVPIELKPLLSLYLMNFFTTPVTRDGKRREFEDVVLELEKETLHYDIDTEGVNGEMIYLTMTTEPERYGSVISWLKTMLFDAIHDPVRLYSSVTKMLAEIPDYKRDGDTMLYAVDTMIKFQQSSSFRAKTTLSRAPYLKRVKKLLKEDEATVIANLSEMCRLLHRPENFRIQVAGNIENLPQPVAAWNALTSGLDMGRPLQPLDDRKAKLSTVGENPGSSAYIVPMSTIDSSFALLTAKGPDSWEHPDLPAVMVAAAYMDQVEGPLWVAVRGTGAAYGSNFSRVTNLGHLLFKIYRSPDPFKAYAAAKEQVKGYARGTLPFDRFSFEGAISSIVLNFANEQPNMAAAAELSFVSQVLQGKSTEWNHRMLAKVRGVTAEQAKAAMAKYFVPVFDPESASLVVTCAQIMVESTVAKFREAGFAPEVRSLETFQDDYGLKVGEGGEVDEDDDDDEEEDDGEEDDDEDEAMDSPDSEEEEEEEEENA